MKNSYLLATLVFYMFQTMALKKAYKMFYNHQTNYIRDFIVSNISKR